MKTLKYLTLVVLWPTLSYSEESGIPEAEMVAKRNEYGRLPLVTDGQVPPKGVTNARAEADRMPRIPWPDFEGLNREVHPVWTPKGPSNFAGRIRCAAIKPVNSPREPRTIYIGAVAGGVWKSTDSGTTWVNTWELQPNMVVNCLKMDPTDPNTIYAGTGEGTGPLDAQQGDGIFKTTDGGATWLQLPSTKNTATTREFEWVNGIAINPANHLDVIAAVRLYPPVDGFYGRLQRSLDGGITWSAVLSLAAPMGGVVFRPVGLETTTMHAWATSLNGHVFNSDDGNNWIFNPYNGLPPLAWGQRIEVAISKSNPAIIYAAKAAIYESPAGIYRSTDGGYTFAFRGTPNDPNVPDGQEGGQGQLNWYACTIAVDSTNPENIFVGGVFLVRSTNGGVSYTQAGSNNNFHLDEHMIVLDPEYGSTNNTVYVGNDGGLFRADDILTPCSPGAACIEWTDLNRGLGITQFYSLAVDPSGMMVSGTQDNGTLLNLPIPYSTDWQQIRGGDGGYCAIELPYVYGESWSLQLWRHDGGDSQWIGRGIDRQECGIPCANFIAPFVKDPNDPNRMIAGGNHVWRTNNARAQDPKDVIWSSIREPLADNSYVNTIAIPESNSDVAWVGYNNGKVFYTTTGPALTPTWINGDPFGDLPPNRFITRIVVGPPEVGMPTGTVYATFGGFYPSLIDPYGNIWKRNADGHWQDIHSNLPSCPINTVIVSSTANPERLYVGTEIGVFTSNNRGGIWYAGGYPSGYELPDILGGGGPVNTRVVDLVWKGTGHNRELVAATHGAGVWGITATR